MRLARTVLSLLVVFSLIAVIGGTFLTGWMLLRAQPQRGGELVVPGLDEAVIVRRDANGFAHLYASSPHDLFMAQGYVHASERMWQMETFRRIGAGRLAELFGESQLDTDRFIRTLGWRQAAESDFAQASPAVRDALEAYSEGVNAWLADNPQLPLPFVVTGLLAGKGGGIDGYRPEPWTPVDSVVFAKVQGWVLSGNYAGELFRYLLARKVDAAAVDELYEPYSTDHPTIVGGATVSGGPTTGSAKGTLPPAALAAADPTALSRLLAVTAGLRAVVGGGPSASVLDAGGAGSNGWALAPERSTTGFPLLANDPHLGVSLPSIWFIVGLHCRPFGDACPYDVAGGSFPSVPGVILGHNRHIAWGATNSGPDVQDLFVERLDRADPTRYEYRGEMRSFEVRTETIKVAGGRDVTLTVRSTVHGPVIDDAVKPLAPADAEGGALGDPGYVLALRWTALVGAESNLEPFLRLNRATGYADFRAALADFGGPAQNFVYADDAGHVAWQLAGHIPIRDGGLDGSVPVAGWDGAGNWTGYVPFEELPRLLDPPSGAVITANNAPVGADYPYFLGREWDAGYRAARITELLGQKERFSPEDLRLIQLDDRLLRAAPLVAAVGEADPDTADGRLVRDRVARWDGTAGAGSSGTAAAEVLAYRLLRNVFDDELGAGAEKDALARRFVGSQQARSVLARLLTEAHDGAASERWWDDVTTPNVVETPADILARACDEAGAALREALGEPDGWTWGRLHRMVYREPTLGSSGIGPFELIFDRGPVPVGGSFDAVLNTVWIPSVAYPDPYDESVRPADLFGVFETVVAPSYRAIYDAGDWDASRIVFTTGQSGHPLDRHFADLIDPWIEGDLLPFPFSDSAVRAATTETLILQP